jgi:hypothetical protein
MWKHIRAILLLPGVMTVLVRAIMLATRGSPSQTGTLDVRMGRIRTAVRLQN